MPPKVSKSVLEASRKPGSGCIWPAQLRQSARGCASWSRLMRCGQLHLPGAGSRRVPCSWTCARDSQLRPLQPVATLRLPQAPSWPST